jgi:cell division protein FtsW (lipid II flippase)
MGVILWITVQAFINIAVVLQLLPVLGVPLPLVSAGGSSMVSGIAAIGVVLSFERANHIRLGGRTTGSRPAGVRAGSGR